VLVLITEMSLLLTFLSPLNDPPRLVEEGASA
jgi:hypothetical protein